MNAAHKHLPHKAQLRAISPFCNDVKKLAENTQKLLFFLGDFQLLQQIYFQRCWHC
jgi:hypothetical protein